LKLNVFPCVVIAGTWICYIVFGDNVFCTWLRQECIWLLTIIFHYFSELWPSEQQRKANDH